jgi:hypothetical protein
MAWIVCLTLVALLAVAGYRIERLQREARMRQAFKHSTTTTLALEAVSAKVKADALRDAAEAWTTVGAEAERKRLSWTPQVRNAENPSMVVTWLNHRADQIEGVEDGRE